MVEVLVGGTKAAAVVAMSSVGETVAVGKKAHGVSVTARLGVGKLAGPVAATRLQVAQARPKVSKEITSDITEINNASEPEFLTLRFPIVEMPCYGEVKRCPSARCATVSREAAQIINCKPCSAH
jgi:hypothetical protein